MWENLFANTLGDQYAAEPLCQAPRSARARAAKLIELLFLKCGLSNNTKAAGRSLISAYL
jgi:hypothetical protein